MTIDSPEPRDNWHPARDRDKLNGETGRRSVNRVAGSHTCELCQEVRRNAAASPAPVTQQQHRLIMREAGLDVMAGLGSLVPGYALVVPHRHVPSSGDLLPEERDLLHRTACSVAALIQRVFDCRVVMVEHGSSGKEAGQIGGGCITHCHLHLFPLPLAADPQSLVPPGSSAIDDLEPLATAASRQENYYFCSWLPATRYLNLEPPPVSQYARRAWARLMNLSDMWDWAAFPYIENCRITVSELRRDEAHMRHTTEIDILSETIAAYEANAVGYAAATNSFATNSTLPGQIDELLKATGGPVLDAGAGAGRDAHHMARTGRSVIALDASASLLGQVKWSSKFHRVVADMRSLPLANASVGAIWCSAVLLHLGQQDLQRALDELHRVLWRGGIMQVSVKEGRGMVSEPLGRSDTIRHFFLYELSELCAFADSAGFDIIRAWTEEEDSSGQTLQRWAKTLLRKID
ncbi:methyltransferase domain-containing protein [Micromonospora sp. CP22]|uniref:methyltransferase domain-containing protein n=1 Tax=Micromonospora sp. CP22 TaxID=2580517 RepID=UPI0012BC123C|nr:methyltransferase domain-containing protein [Micromonospora sp. CP22]MTK04523.1 methyltransferase domain-containing protein [Micromonospora sp. CP22]